MDMTRATHAEIEKGPLWQQDRAYTTNVKPTLFIEEVDKFFDENSDILIRDESKKYEMRSHRTNRTIYEVAQKDYLLLLDSDIEFKNNKFFKEANDMLAHTPEERFGIMGNFSKALNFGVDKSIHLSRKKDPYKKLLDYCETAYDELMKDKLDQLTGFPRQANVDDEGIRQKGTFPRLDPAFLLINRKAFVEKEILFDITYLDIDDYSDSQQFKEWRILGDEGAGIIYQIAKNKLKAINVDYNQWAEHKCGAWQSVSKDNYNWFYLGRDYPQTDRDYWYDNEAPEELFYRVKKD